MIAWLRRLVAAPRCPGCGRELVAWTTSMTDGGYIVEQLWRGCPAYREAVSSAERAHHQASWRRGQREPLWPDGVS